MIGVSVFLASVLTLAALYAIFAMILNFEAGWGGMWDLGPVAFIGVGSYTFVILTASAPTLLFAPELPIAIAWVISSLVGAFFAFLIGALALRLRGEYFLITTFSFSVVIVELFTAEADLTGGSAGLRSFPRPFQDMVGVREYNFLLLGLVIVFALCVFLILRRLAHSPFGRALRALTNNEAASLSVGRNATRLRLKAFVFTGAMFAAAGPLYAFYIRSIFPNMFATTVSFTLWTAMVVGGIGNMSGVIIGALALIGLTEATQFLQVNPEYASVLAAARPIIIGIALLLIVRLRPQGILPEARAFAKPRERSLGTSA